MPVHFDAISEGYITSVSHEYCQLNVKQTNKHKAIKYLKKYQQCFRQLIFYFCENTIQHIYNYKKLKQSVIKLYHHIIVIEY